MKKAAEREVRDLIAELRVQFNDVREKSEFLKLKQLELRPDDWISQTMFRDAQDQWHIEQSLLAGHAFMIGNEVRRRHIELDPATRRFLDAVGSQPELK